MFPRKSKYCENKLFRGTSETYHFTPEIYKFSSTLSMFNLCLTFFVFFHILKNYKLFFTLYFIENKHYNYNKITICFSLVIVLKKIAMLWILWVYTSSVGISWFFLVLLLQKLILMEEHEIYKKNKKLNQPSQIFAIWQQMQKHVNMTWVHCCFFTKNIKVLF